MATTGPASVGVPSSSAAAAAAVSTTPNSVMSPPAITSSSSVADSIASSATGTAIAPTPNYSKRKYIAFWDSDGAGVDSWIGKITGPFQNVVAPTTATTTPTSTTDDNNNIKKEQEGTYLYDALYAVLYTAPYIGIVLLTVDYPWSENKTTQKKRSFYTMCIKYNTVVADVDG